MIYFEELILRKNYDLLCRVSGDSKSFRRISGVSEILFDKITNVANFLGCQKFCGKITIYFEEFQGTQKVFIKWRRISWVSEILREKNMIVFCYKCRRISGVSEIMWKMSHLLPLLQPHPLSIGSWSLLDDCWSLSVLVEWFDNKWRNISGVSEILRKNYDLSDDD